MNTYEDIMSLDPEKMNVTIWWKIFDMNPTPPKNDLKLLPDYCGDNSVAFSVIEKLSDDFSYRVQSGLDTKLKRIHIFEFHTRWDKPKMHRASAHTFSMAVCRAALMAILDVEEPKD